MKHIAIKVNDDIDYEALVEQLKNTLGVTHVYVEHQYYPFNDGYLQREDIELEELDD